MLHNELCYQVRNIICVVSMRNQLIVEYMVRLDVLSFMFFLLIVCRLFVFLQCSLGRTELCNGFTHTSFCDCCLLCSVIVIVSLFAAGTVFAPAANLRGDATLVRNLI